MKKRNKAQSLVEYGLILALVAVIAVTALGRFSTSATQANSSQSNVSTQSSSNTLESYCKSINKAYNEADGTCK